MSPDEAGVSFVILAKDATLAKTRLKVDKERARSLARDLAEHSIATATAARCAGAVFVVTSDIGIKEVAQAHGAVVVDEGSPKGMNAAAEMGRIRALDVHPEQPVAVLVADLPMLRADDLDSAVGEFRNGATPLFVADHEGVGTTFLIHSPSQCPGLAFGRRSAWLHGRLGYVPAVGTLRGLRRDLDTPEDLRDLSPIWR